MIMKRILLFIWVMFFASGVLFAQSQYTSQEINELAKELAKEYKKEGWRVDPGELPIEFQLRKSVKMMNEMVEEDVPKYIFGTAKASGKSTIGAYATARQFAMDEIIKQVRVIVEDFTKKKLNTEQKEGEVSEDIYGIISNGTTRTVLKIGNFINVVKCYKLLDDKKTLEAQIVIACSRTDIEKAIVMTIDDIENGN